MMVINQKPINLMRRGRDVRAKSSAGTVKDITKYQSGPVSRQDKPMSEKMVRFDLEDSDDLEDQKSIEKFGNEAQDFIE